MSRFEINKPASCLPSNWNAVKDGYAIIRHNDELQVTALHIDLCKGVVITSDNPEFKVGQIFSRLDIRGWPVALPEQTFMINNSGLAKQQEPVTVEA